MSDSQIDKKSQLLVRINGTMPDLTTMGDEEKSEGFRSKENGYSCQHILFCICDKFLGRR
ncbi:MAG: hypothetical protein WCF23_06195 [Candidatus Nitrosopolaris sp.]